MVVSTATAIGALLMVLLLLTMIFIMTVIVMMFRRDIPATLMVIQ